VLLIHQLLEEVKRTAVLGSRNQKAVHASVLLLPLDIAGCCGMPVLLVDAAQLLPLKFVLLSALLVHIINYHDGQTCLTGSILAEAVGPYN
jgi:hypothetical protein